MAMMFPDRLPGNASPSEKPVYRALEKLPDPWRVFHSVAWQSLRKGRQGDGEADFVLIHPRHGLIVIEAKGGSIHIRDGKWFSSNKKGSHPIDPFEQATASKHALVGYLRDTIPDLPWLEAGHGVWFPTITVSGDISAAAPDEIVLDRSDLAKPVIAINDLVNRWKLHGAIPDEFVEAITKRLAPTVTIRHTLADDVAEVHARQLALTETQRLALAGLRRARRVIVYGGAGTGKTVLAVERARRLSADGFRVVLTCFNRPLGDAFADEFADNDLVTAGSFHHLANGWITEAGLEFPEEIEPGWWDDPAGELLLEAFTTGDFRADAIIIDEGQDFDDSWFMALEAAIDDPAEGLFLVFADRQQAIYRENWEPPFDAVEYALDLNCRNTNQIAEVVARVYGDDLPARGADGPKPEFHAVESPEGIDKALRGVLHRLVNEGAIPADRVVILTQYREAKDRLIGTTSAGLTLDAIGTPDAVAVETIHRFKGLETDATIVILDRLEKVRDHALAYIGLSRARFHLVVIGPEGIGETLGLN
ncbi:MAG: NERD domain-containing protein [Actinomycetota bacterium]|nr:NERD domain-containing protein [Actinomycetota bacterium]